MARLVLATLVVAFSPWSVHAALDPELKKPYELTVVLHMAEHRVLTRVFQEGVQRELQAHLQGALGDLATVHVVREHPLLAEVEAKGLQQALDGWKTITDSKSHFVLVDFVNGAYDIQARQHDGSTGLASPMVRRERIQERLLVARTAALMVAHDFGLVGTLDDKTNDPTAIRVALKGGGLGISLEHWIHKDDVFAIAKILPTSQLGGSKSESTRVEWALLQVVAEPRDGICTCRLWNRHTNPLARDEGVCGYRCLKLGTIEAPLRLRLVRDRKTGAPLSGCTVKVSPSGFQSRSQEQRVVKNADGFVTTENRYRNIAFVVVELNQIVLANIPVEIMGDQTLVCFVSVDKNVEKRGQLDREKSRWLGRLSESHDVQATLFKEVSTLAEKDRERALERARKGLEAVKTDIGQRRTELVSLKRTAEGLGLANQLDVNTGHQPLQELEAGRIALESYIKNLETILKEENNPKIQEWRASVERAKLLESQAEFGQALELYEKVLHEGAEDKNLATRVKELKEAWQIKGDEHRDARAFIYDTWPQLTKAADLNVNLAKARAAFETCRQVGDLLSPQKLLKASVAHAGNLAKELDELAGQNNEDARNTAQTIDEASAGLGKLITDVSAGLPKPKAAPK